MKRPNPSISVQTDFAVHVGYKAGRYISEAAHTIWDAEIIAAAASLEGAVFGWFSNEGDEPPTIKACRDRLLFALGNRRSTP